MAAKSRRRESMTGSVVRFRVPNFPQAPCELWRAEAARTGVGLNAFVSAALCRRSWLGPGAASLTQRLNNHTVALLSSFVPERDLRRMRVVTATPFCWFPAGLRMAAATFGPFVMFRPGSFDTTTPPGLALIAHEAHHIPPGPRDGTIVVSCAVLGGPIPMPLPPRCSPAGSAGDRSAASGVPGAAAKIVSRGRALPTLSPPPRQRKIESAALPGDRGPNDLKDAAVPQPARGAAPGGEPFRPRILTACYTPHGSCAWKVCLPLAVALWYRPGTSVPPSSCASQPRLAHAMPLSRSASPRCFATAKAAAS